MSLRTRKLDAVEIGVLRGLLGKEQRNSDQYPLTGNALISPCNQKTGRNPVTRLIENGVVEAVDRMPEDIVVWRGDGARSSSPSASGRTQRFSRLPGYRRCSQTRASKRTHLRSVNRQ